ncbi:MAG TPA: DHA2 family efflux MFS transporter permease subunit [Novosphingobium sp.]
MNSQESLATRVVATGGVMLATLMTVLDTTIANVALPHIQGSLAAAQDQITWVLTSYMLGTAITMPLTGWASQKLGRKRLLLISIGAFAAVSMLCGLATSLPELLLFRLLQGVAGAAMTPLSQSVVLDSWPQPVIPQVMAVWSAVVMVAPILGPTLGGMLTENYSWRWVFYINLPLGALAFVLVSSALGPDPDARGRPFDMLGFGSLVLFTVAAQLMFDRGPALDWFGSREIWAEAIVAVCALYVFVMQTLTGRHPFFHRGLFVDRNYVTGVIINAAVAAMLFSTSALLPTLMQTLLGYSALQSGYASAPRGVGSLVALTFVPWMAARFGVRRTVAIGLLLSVAGLRRMGYFDLSMTPTPIFVAGFIQGFGQGMIMSPMAVLSFATLAPERRTEAAVLGNMVRTIAAGLGVAGLQAISTRQSATAHERLAAHVIPTDPIVGWSLRHLAGLGGGLEAINAEVTRQAAMIGYDAAFGWMSIACLGLLPLLFIIRPAKPAGSTILEVHEV